MKQHYIAILLIIFSIFSFQKNANSTICSSTSAGNWNQFEIWSCGRVPACGDTIYVNHLVQITANVVLDNNPTCINTATFIVITNGGDLNFDSGRKMSLGCGSGVSIEAGGQITSDGGGASENLKICNTVVWQGSWDADLDGPTTLGSGLPIELISFDAFYVGKQVELNWITATETNNDFFTVERGNNGIDFEPVLITDGAGTSNNLTSYSETDYSPLTGNSYYRLRQTDYDGRISFSRTVNVNSSYLNAEMQLFPNPTDGNFKIQLNGFGEEKFVVLISDLAGKEIFSKAFTTSNDSHIELIDPSNKLAAGTYMVTAKSSNKLHTQKLIVR